MKLHNRIGQLVGRRARKAQDRKPMLEIFEPRIVMSTGFIQGYALNGAQVGVAGAVMTLYDSSHNVLQMATSSSTGYYAFNNLAPGNYSVTETTVPAGYTVSPATPQTTINPASINGTSVNVTVENLATLPEITTTYTKDAVSGLSSAYYFLNPSSYNVAGNNHLTSPNNVGGFELSLAGPAGTTVSAITSYCSDLTQDIDGAPVIFFVEPSLTPTSTTQPGLATNYGELGYLYNTYGRTDSPIKNPLNNGYGDSINSAGLQLAVWALEYNTNPVASLSSPNSPFQVNSTLTNAQVLASANAYLADAAGKSEDFYFLNAVAATTAGRQGMMSTDLVNFTNAPTNSSSVATAIFDSTGGAVTGAYGEKVYDTATVTGTLGTPTGTVTYNFYNTANPVYGTILPVSTKTVTLTGGNVPNSALTAGLTAGSYAYIAVYSGDSNYIGDVGAVEPLTINKGTVSESTTIHDSGGGSVTGAYGEQVYDTATVTGTLATPTGTVTYNFYNTSTPTYGVTTPTSTQTVTLSGGVVPNSALTSALTAGSYSYIGYYSGDSNFGSFAGAVEPLTINKLTASESTTIYDSSSGPVTGAYGEQVYDTATVTGTLATPTGTLTYNFYNTLTPTYGVTTPSSTQTVTLSGGLVPNSSLSPALLAGSYSYIGYYSGDSNYGEKLCRSAVEPLSIGKRHRRARARRSMIRVAAL